MVAAARALDLVPAMAVATVGVATARGTVTVALDWELTPKGTSLKAHTASRDSRLNKSMPGKDNIFKVNMLSKGSTPKMNMPSRANNLTLYEGKAKYHLP